MDTAEVHSDWYKRISKEIVTHRASLNPKDYKKYKLDLLLRVSGRVDSFSALCGTCQLAQQEIGELIRNFGNLIHIPDKEGRKRHVQKINRIVNHLKKQHKLVTEKQFLNLGMAIGAGAGTALAAIPGNAGIGTGMGVAIGMGIGSYLDKKAKKEGRVI